MTPLDVLKNITKYTEEKIAPLLLMRKEVRHSGDIMDNSDDLPEYVNPSVCYGMIPHKNFQPLDFSVPMIMWTFDQVDDNGTYDSGRTVSLRAYVGAYSSEIFEDNDTKIPDHKAFEDLYNVLEKIYIEITRKHVLNGVGIIKPISYGIYDGAYYPYAYGWLTLTAEIPRMLFDDDIDEDIDLDEI